MRSNRAQPRFLAVLLLVFGPPASGQPTGTTKGDPGAERLREMTSLAQAIKLSEIEHDRAGPPVAVHAEPLMRYSDPPRHIQDATLWAWSENGRPLAVLKVEFMPEMDLKHRWVNGLVSLSPRLISVEFGDGQRWSSRRPGLEQRAIPDAPVPADAEGARLAPLKALARRFTASEYDGPARGRLQLRLMPKPLHRYASPSSGLSDGAIFSFVFGTNPEVLLIIEASNQPSAAPDLALWPRADRWRRAGRRA